MLLHLQPAAVPAVDVNTHLHPLQVLLREVITGGWVGQEKRVVGITGWVLLRLEQTVKVPETALHIVVGGHLLEAHLGEDFAVLAAHLCEAAAMERQPSHDVNCHSSTGLPAAAEAVMTDGSRMALIASSNIRMLAGKLQATLHSNP